jgi:DNA-directed RNA polymerase subunit RPC12/RpoP
MPEVIEHKCPQCGATIQFDIESQKVVCEYCGGEFEPSLFDSADEGLSISADDIDLATNGGEKWDDSEMEMFSEYACESCGAALYTDSTTSATVCPFCRSAVILRGRLSGVLMPDKVIPFKQTKEQALEALANHYTKKRFIPKGFKENNKLDEVKGLYVPYWVYDAEISADMNFLGTKERVIAPGKNADVKEISYYGIERKGTIRFDHVPADASSKMPDDLMETLEPYDFAEAEDFKTAYLSGYVADKYDVPQEDVMDRIKQRVADGTEDQFRTTIGAYDSVTLRSADLKTTESNVDYVLYPVWLFNMSWNDRTFTFAMNGQTGKFAGDLPVDKLKLRLFTLGVFGLMMIIGWVVMGHEFYGDDLVNYLVYSTLIFALMAWFVHFYFKSELKNVEFQHGSREYYREGSMDMEIQEDRFLYKKIKMDR